VSAERLELQNDATTKFAFIIANVIVDTKGSVFPGTHLLQELLQIFLDVGDDLLLFSFRLFVFSINPCQGFVTQASGYKDYAIRPGDEFFYNCP
jgi:hypothetical protein